MALVSYNMSTMVRPNLSHNAEHLSHVENQIVFGIPFTTQCFDEVVEEILIGAPPGAGARLYFTANIDHIVQLSKTPVFRAAYAKAWSRTIDGTPVHLYALARRHNLHKITGADLLPAICEGLDPSRHRVFTVCSNVPTGEAAKARFGERGFDPKAITFDVPPFGFEHDAAYSDALAERIRQHGTTHLFFCVGAPKSEIWLADHVAALGDCVAMSWGAAMDFWVGTKKRAPAAFRRSGMEWAWRLGTEPKRLAKRYLVDSWRFAAVVIDDLKGRVGSEV